MAAADAIERATENQLNRFLAKWATPLLLTGLIVMADRKLDDLSTTQEAQGQELSKIKSDVRDVNTKLDVGIVQQVKDLQRRVDQLERATPTP